MTDLQKDEFLTLVGELKKSMISINNDYAHLIDDSEEMKDYIPFTESIFESIKKIPKR